MPRSPQPGRGDLDPPPSTGYPSAYDIPEFKKLREQMIGMQVLTFLNPKMRRETRQLKEQLDRIVGSVERFYELLGERHWVFHGSLNPDVLAPALAGGDSDTAEKAVIAHYQDEQKMKFALLRAQAVPEMRPRAALLDHAFRDYIEGRYYSAVLVLITIIDGFVNEVGERRRGLHAREAEELVAWNSVTAHHLGLAATQASFTKRFNKTSVEPVYELHRNGIVHGNLTNFDNLVVASKAWNRLFAVLDWRLALDEGKKPEPVTPTFRESAAKLVETRKRSRDMNAWTPRALTVDEDGLEVLEGEPVVQATMAMLDAWKSRNYGRLAEYFNDPTRPKSMKAFVGQVRGRFESRALERYEVIALNVVAPAVAHVTVNLVTSGEAVASELRWLHADREGNLLTEGAPEGSWMVIQLEPEAMLGREW